MNRILLVEDNRADVELTFQMLRVNRILNPLDVCETVHEAQDYLFGGTQSPPKLVILDLNLLGYDDLHILRHMRADDRTKDIKVIVLTVSGHDEDVVKSFSVGVNAYLRKPITLLSLTSAVKAMDMGWLLIDEGDVS